MAKKRTKYSHSCFHHTYSKITGSHRSRLNYDYPPMWVWYKRSQSETKKSKQKFKLDTTLVERVIIRQYFKYLELFKIYLTKIYEFMLNVSDKLMLRTTSDFFFHLFLLSTLRLFLQTELRNSTKIGFLGMYFCIKSLNSDSYFISRIIKIDLCWRYDAFALVLLLSAFSSKFLI